MTKVFIDGSAGTTGLRIRERLAQRADIRLIEIDEAHRKDSVAVSACLNAADVAFLCLPDDAAREAVGLVQNSHTVILDTSTAHRCAPGWVYGFPEIMGRDTVASAKRIAVPGCHASGVIALLHPLIQAGILPKESLVSCFSLTGYSGGGKKMIAQYEDPNREALLDAPRQYALGQTHKHLAEMQRYTGLDTAPVFSPVVADFYSGMEVTVPLFRQMLAPGKDVSDIRASYSQAYAGPIVTFAEDPDADGFLSAGAFSCLDTMRVSVFGNDDRILLTARYDNLGKGASGAAIQCMNLVIGAQETDGLLLS